MIEAAAFVGAARARGFELYSGVPCSYLTLFINYVLGADGLRYIGAANEGDAVAIAAGASLGGWRGIAMFQNSVRDYGPGIPAAERGAVFERFRRGTRQQSGSVPGVGLGLYLARTILTHHGGDLQARGPKDGGKGACFVFTLPAARQLRRQEEPTEVKTS